MSETMLWNYLSVKLKKKLGYRGHFVRVESHATSIGFPDINYCVDGVEGGIELKYVPDLRVKPKVRPAQVGWHTARASAGGRSYILLHLGYPTTFILVPGYEAISLLDKGAADWMALACWTCPDKFDTDSFIDAITRREK